MITVVIKLKHYGLIENYARVPDERMADDEAYFDPKAKILYIRESTFCAANSEDTHENIKRQRARFTIAHEIGHIALGHSELRHRGKIANVHASGRIWHDERVAQRFAAAFLAPAHLA
jgi:Zn-dependent peptidase ImmA (M78 family)